MNNFIQSLFLLMILITQYVKKSNAIAFKTHTEETIIKVKAEYLLIVIDENLTNMNRN